MGSAVERGEISLEEVKNQRSTTPRTERDRCPRCHSVKIEKKQLGEHEHEGRQPGEYRCQKDGCGHHFDDPVSGIDPHEGGAV